MEVASWERTERKRMRLMVTSGDIRLSVKLEMWILKNDTESRVFESECFCKFR